jgi:hypothetical protein
LFLELSIRLEQGSAHWPRVGSHFFKDLYFTARRLDRADLLAGLQAVLLLGRREATAGLKELAYEKGLLHEFRMNKNGLVR